MKVNDGAADELVDWRGYGWLYSTSTTILDVDVYSIMSSINEIK